MREFHSLLRPVRAGFFVIFFLFLAPDCDSISFRNLHHLLEDWAEAQTMVLPQAPDLSFAAEAAMRQRSKCLPAASKVGSDSCRLRKSCHLLPEGGRMNLARAE